ncbi:MAG: ParB N-terminal domain-containing protein [Okeania sp. SIO3I5]|uniref:Rho termination factor N-terminal domain-containing protein n=1 Tax=Okeania sp. SIO3I5 TaxID=2607805 RepID=UPI0013BCB8F9|nr:ParB N-terminal domain-containing protein [Okeania sp. SIO3I5]NEQ38221.1 ParB N-terminal domain-containing protein [Okeania sp. SIO3I5]
MVSGQPKNQQEELSAQPVRLELIPISKITVPESQERDISPERYEALFDSFADRGSNLIPLLVRLMDNYDSEQQYEIIYGADWCQVAKEIEIKELWAWIYEITDEQVEMARAQMEKLTQAAMPETQNFDPLVEQLKVSFDRKVDSLTQKIDQSINKNEEVIKKQVKSLQVPSTEIAQIEQFQEMITNLENSVHNKVETLARKIASSTIKKTTSNLKGVKMELLSKQLDDLDKQIEKKLEGMVKTVNQFEQLIQDIEDDLKTQVSAVRRQLQAIPELDSTVEVETKTETPPKATTKSKPTSTSRSKATSTKTTTRKTKASSAAQAEPEVPIDDYDTKSLRQLKKIAQERKLRGYARMKRPEILKALREADAAS